MATETKTRAKKTRKPASRQAQRQQEESAKLPAPEDVFPERSHAEGCPMPEGRVEVFIANRPRKTDSNGDLVERARKVVVAHCVECGETRNVPDDELDADLLKTLTA